MPRTFPVRGPRGIRVGFGLSGDAVPQELWGTIFNPTNVMSNVDASVQYYESRRLYGDTDPRTLSALNQWNTTRAVISIPAYVPPTYVNAPSSITPVASAPPVTSVQSGVPPTNVPTTVTNPQDYSQAQKLFDQLVLSNPSPSAPSNTSVVPTTGDNAGSSKVTSTPLQSGVQSVGGYLNDLWHYALGDNQTIQGEETSNQGGNWIDGIPNWVIVGGIVLGAFAFAMNSSNSQGD